MRYWASIPLVLALAGCQTDQVATGYGVHADSGLPITAQENADMASRKKADCQRLYGLLGDPKTTQQQAEAIRVSMAAKSCAAYAP